MKGLINNILLFLLIPFISNATINDLPVRKISRSDFYIYFVKSEMTELNEIADSLGITKEDILRYNPDAASDIREGQFLFFPVADFNQDDNACDSVKETDYSATTFNHTIKSGETLYGISKLYDVEIDSIVAYNPQSKNGIKSGSVLIIPQKNIKATNVNDNIIFHTITKGNTLYNLSNKYNTSIEEIIELNPGVSPDNFKIDEVLKIRVNSRNDRPEGKRNLTDVTFYDYEIQDDDSFENIINKFHVCDSVIRQANDIVDLPGKGNVISIPFFEHLSDVEKFRVERMHGIEIYDSIKSKTNDDNEIKIALILPLMLDKTSVKNNQANLYREFYKGFLISVDSLRCTTDKKINVLVYDSGNSIDTINNILKKEPLKSADLIIGPNDKKQFDLVSEFCILNDVNLVNPFIINSEDYNNNDKFFHVNIPNTFMHTKLINYYDELFQDWTPVFINSKLNDPKEISLKIKDEISKREKKFYEINFDKYLTYEAIDSILINEDKYIIIPLNSSRSMLRKILPTLKKLKHERVELDLALFGYPEWTSYSNLYKSSFKELDTYVYSRFFLDEENEKYIQFLDKFNNWYGENLINALPAFGLLGYELGKYFISNLIYNNLDVDLSKTDGIQTPIEFIRISNWGGYVNWAICFIHYKNNKVERMVR